MLLKILFVTCLGYFAWLLSPHEDAQSIDPLIPPNYKEIGQEYELTDQGLYTSIEIEVENVPVIADWYKRKGFYLWSETKQITEGSNRKGGRFRLKTNIKNNTATLEIWCFEDL